MLIFQIASHLVRSRSSPLLTSPGFRFLENSLTFGVNRSTNKPCHSAPSFGLVSWSNVDRALAVGEHRMRPTRSRRTRIWPLANARVYLASPDIVYKGASPEQDVYGERVAGVRHGKGRTAPEPQDR